MWSGFNHVNNTYLNPDCLQLPPPPGISRADITMISMAQE